MATFQGILLLAMGVGLLAITYQSLSTGWLPYGSNWLRAERLKAHRDTQPVGYWFLVCFYTTGGLWISWHAIRVLAGTSPPLPWN